MEMGPPHNVNEQWCSISKSYQWVSKQKDFHWGAVDSEPTQWNDWHLVRGFQTTCESMTWNMEAYTSLSRRSAEAKFQYSPIVRFYKKNKNLKTARPKSHLNLLVTEILTSWQSHTCNKNIQRSDKNPINFGLVLSTPHHADRDHTQ